MISYGFVFTRKGVKLTFLLSLASVCSVSGIIKGTKDLNTLKIGKTSKSFTGSLVLQ